MLYNDTIGYNAQGINYQGTVILNIPSIGSTLVLENINVVISLNEDFSNYTTIGTISLEYSESGVITIEASPEQAYAITQAETIYVNDSSEITFEIFV